MSLTQEQKVILYAINEKTINADVGLTFNEVVQHTELSRDDVRDDLEILKDKKCITYSEHPGTRNSGGNFLMEIKLTRKGQLALEQPDALVETPTGSSSHVSIGGSVYAPVQILQNSDNNNVALQYAQQDIVADLKKVQELRQIINHLPADKLPDDDREAALLQLDHLKQELESPTRRNPKAVGAYLKAFLGAVLAASTYLASTADFANNATDLAQKFSVDITRLLPGH